MARACASVAPSSPSLSPSSSSSSSSSSLPAAAAPPPVLPAASLAPHGFFLAWGGVLVLAFEGFGPTLRAAKAAVSGALPGLGAEGFGSLWAKATLAPTAAGAPPLTLRDLADLRRLCAAHGRRFADRRLAAAADEAEAEAEAAERGHATDRNRLCVLPAGLHVVHYTARGLESAWRPVRVLIARLGPPAAGGALAGATSAEEAAAAEEDAAERARAVGVVSEWCGDRLSAYLPRANARAGETDAASYRERSPRGSTLVAFLGLPDRRAPGGAGLAEVLSAFRDDIDRRFPGRFAWLEQASLHCTLRSLGAVG